MKVKAADWHLVSKQVGRHSTLHVMPGNDFAPSLCGAMPKGMWSKPASWYSYKKTREIIESKGMCKKCRHLAAGAGIEISDELPSQPTAKEPNHDNR